jgi:hypothetical protein
MQSMFNAMPSKQNGNMYTLQTAVSDMTALKRNMLLHMPHDLHCCCTLPICCYGCEDCCMLAMLTAIRPVMSEIECCSTVALLAARVLVCWKAGAAATVADSTTHHFSPRTGLSCL